MPGYLKQLADESGMCVLRRRCILAVHRELSRMAFGKTQHGRQLVNIAETLKHLVILGSSDARVQRRRALVTRPGVYPKAAHI